LRVAAVTPSGALLARAMASALPAADAIALHGVHGPATIYVERVVE
jgi:hypothetical protein